MLIELRQAPFFVPVLPHVVAPSPAGKARVYTTPKYLDSLPFSNLLAIPAAGSPVEKGSVFVVDSLDLSVMAMAAEGGTVLVLDNHDSQSKNSWFETQPARFKTAWWLGSPTDNNMGTVVYDDRWEGLFDGMAPEGWADEGWFRLIEGGPSSLSKPLSLAMCQPCSVHVLLTSRPIHGPTPALR